MHHHHDYGFSFLLGVLCMAKNTTHMRGTNTKKEKSLLLFEHCISTTTLLKPELLLCFELLLPRILNPLESRFCWTQWFEIVI